MLYFKFFSVNVEPDFNGLWHVMGQNECTGSEVSGNLSQQRVSVYLQNDRNQAKISYSYAYILHIFVVLLYNLPVIHDTVLQTSWSYVLSTVLL